MKKLRIYFFSFASLIFFFHLIFQDAWANDFEFLEKEFNEVLNLLPPYYLPSLKKDIILKIKSFSTDKNIQDDLCKIEKGHNNRRMLAYVKKSLSGHYEISVSQALVRMAQTNTQTFNCFHKNYQSTLKAALIHELTHIKDFKEKISLGEKFELLVGVRHETKNPYRAVFNQNFMSSPNPYEFLQLREALAVNAEYFFLDPNFECRRPALARLLSHKLGKELRNSCQINYNILLHSRFLEKNYGKVASLDPSLIYQIHYLFAGKGDKIKSRWGHAMLRIVACSPKRREKDPLFKPNAECLKDRNFHLILNYRASMSHSNSSYIKGLTGYYPITLFINNFFEILDEYNNKGFRDLYSVPIELNSEQIEDFVLITLERYWNYQGKYYFFDNNCGTEIKKHMDLILDKEIGKKISSITPHKMYHDYLKLQEGMEGKELSDLEKEGLFFQSAENKLEKTFETLKSFGLFLGQKRLKDFREKVFAFERMGEYKKLLEIHTQKMSIEEKKKLFMDLKNLESHLRSYFSGISIQVMGNLQKNEGIDFLEDNSTWNKAPWQLIRSQYGNPLKDEFDEQLKSLKETLINDSKKTREISDSAFLNSENEDVKRVQEEQEIFKKIDSMFQEWFIKNFVSSNKVSTAHPVSF